MDFIESCKNSFFQDEGKKLMVLQQEKISTKSLINFSFIWHISYYKNLGIFHTDLQLYSLRV